MHFPEDDEFYEPYDFTHDELVEDALRQWMEWDKNSVTRGEMRHMEQYHMLRKLRKLLLHRLEFGTAGIRGVMGPGYSQINDLVIIQTTQGLCQYVISEMLERETRIVVIGYDGRHNSRRFAELAAVAMLCKNFKVYLFSRLCPTPFVPFAVKLLKAKCGIMITASHNPKEDNGYKVYWENGAQIIPPHDKRIQDFILHNLAPWKNAWETATYVNNAVDPYDTVMDAYYGELIRGTHYPSANCVTPLRFVYTPMHGVGQEYMKKAFATARFKPFISVDEQKDPDPEFPTVKFPNPEEGQSALDLAIQTADKFECSVILANDPDADRLAVGQKSKDGKWRLFNGNEIGALLGWWAFHIYLQEFEEHDLDNVYMLASTVSSKFLKTMALKEGFKFIETLTGFKWMGNKAHDLEVKNPKAKILFAYEEAIGYMMGTMVLDKDGISAGVRVAEMVTYLQTQGQTLEDKLLELYDKYGYHLSDNSYFTFNETGVTQKVFSALRKFSPTPYNGRNYPRSLMKGKYKIINVRDLTVGYDSSQINDRAILPVSSSSEMLTFEFDNGLVATLRTSGTEPKIKYYCEMRARPGDKDLEKIKATLDEMVMAIVQEFLQPERFGLKRREN